MVTCHHKPVPQVVISWSLSPRGHLCQILGNWGVSLILWTQIASKSNQFRFLHIWHNYLLLLEPKTWCHWVKVTFTPARHLGLPINLTALSLDYKRKPEYLEKTNMHEHINSTLKSWFEPWLRWRGTSSFWGGSINHRTLKYADASTYAWSVSHVVALVCGRCFSDYILLKTTMANRSGEVLAEHVCILYVYWHIDSVMSFLHSDGNAYENVGLKLL